MPPIRQRGRVSNGTDDVTTITLIVKFGKSQLFYLPNSGAKNDDKCFNIYLEERKRYLILL